MITFSHLSDYLKHGREIEFAYHGRQYSITNHSGFWYLCDDTDHLLLSTLAPFSDKDLLISRTASAILDGKTVSQIFNLCLYDPETLSIL